MTVIMIMFAYRNIYSDSLEKFSWIDFYLVIWVTLGFDFIF